MGLFVMHTIPDNQNALKHLFTTHLFGQTFFYPNYLCYISNMEKNKDIIKIVDDRTGELIFEGSRSFYRFMFHTMLCPEKGYEEHGDFSLYINGIKYQRHEVEETKS